MKTYEKYAKRLISESTPDNFKVSTIRVTDIFISTQNFFNTNFRGAIVTENVGELFGYVDTSVDGIAYFFKVLLNAVFGNSVVNVTMTQAAGRFYIKTKWRKCREITLTDIAELERSARLSEFSLDFSSDGEFCYADISMKTKNMSYLPVYAISEFKMHTAYVRVFFL